MSKTGTESNRIAQDFAALCKEPGGAEFVKVDLHVHTPASGDAQSETKYNFKFDPDRRVKSRGEAEDIARQMIDQCIAKQLRLIAVTDHNMPSNVHRRCLDLTWYQLLRDAAAKVGKPGVPPVILPGVELSTDDLHVLVILDPDDAPGSDGDGRDVDSAVYMIHRVNGLLRDCGFRLRDYGKFGATGMSSLFDVLQRIESLKTGVIAIAAHIDGGHRALLTAHDHRSNIYTRLLTHPRFNAVEVTEPTAPDSKKKGFGPGGKPGTLREYFGQLRGHRPPVAWLRNSDSHRLKDIAKRHSFVSMGTPSFTALRNALEDPATRVRMDKEHDPAVERTIVEGLAIRKGRGKPNWVRFNRNLNCIIGRKGTHKSTVVDLLIYGLGRFHDDPEEMAIEQWIRDEDYAVAVYIRGGDGTLYCASRGADGKPTVWWTQAGPGFARLPERPAGLARPRKYNHKALADRLRGPTQPMEFIDWRVLQPWPSVRRALERRDKYLQRCQQRGFTGCQSDIRHLQKACNSLFTARRKLSGLLVKEKTSQGELKQVELYLTQYAPPGGDAPLMVRVTKGTYTGTRPRDYTDKATLFMKCDASNGRVKYLSVDGRPQGLANAAVMCLLMNEETFGPLVIDEPEQWLDTAGITEWLVPRMRHVKTRQQIICVTRDEHILLCGDAEHVIVTDSEQQVEIGCSGDTNTEAIQKRILELFEGHADGRHLRTKLAKLEGVLLQQA